MQSRQGKAMTVTKLDLLISVSLLQVKNSWILLIDYKNTQDFKWHHQDCPASPYSPQGNTTSTEVAATSPLQVKYLVPNTCKVQVKYLDPCSYQEWPEILCNSQVSSCFRLQWEILNSQMLRFAQNSHELSRITYCWSKWVLGACLQNCRNIFFCVAKRSSSSMSIFLSSFSKRAIVSSCSRSLSICCWFFACKQNTGESQKAEQS